MVMMLMMIMMNIIDKEGIGGLIGLFRHVMMDLIMFFDDFDHD